MNRYTAAGIAADAANGKRIAVMTRIGSASRQALNEIVKASLVSKGYCTVHWAIGYQSITYPSGGQVIFRSGRNGLRGEYVDVICLDACLDFAKAETDCLEGWLPALQGSTCPEIIRP